ncbi:hypothetical protein J007_06636 [Cryptococcus neoformans]|nr:hypothetical protein J007_06636 [Cryptococcus neoformans var. grubii]OXC57855.1 hypothetical protein C358_06729 [Cryptococcus neoformans var. grubii MW-RSA852]
MRSNIEANLPPTNEGYGTHEYWEERYAKESDGRTFDWFLSPSYLIPFFEELTADIDAGKDARILMLGCGNSALGEVLYDAGWKNIVNIDYSKIVIEQMQERHVEKRPEMTWLEMDVMDLKFGENEFDLVIDKGTMDAMLTTKGDPWNPPEKDIKACTQEISEALRYSPLHRYCMDLNLPTLHLVNPISENGTCRIVAISRSPTERLDHPKDLRTSYMSWLIMWKPEDNLSKLDDVFGISITPALRSEFKGTSVIESSQL